MFSVILIGAAMAVVYGGMVEAYDNETHKPAVQQRQPVGYRIEGSVESIRFGKRAVVNDTVTITVRNLGNVPLGIRGISINEIPHLNNLLSTYMFDAEGNIFFSRTIPAGGFGIIKLTTLPSDMVPEDNIYNVSIRTRFGLIHESFKAGGNTYNNPSGLEPYTPHIFTLLLGSTVGVKDKDAGLRLFSTSPSG
jgi:hypothetical protein